MGKKKTMKARGIRFEDHQWDHLVKKAGKNATLSDYNRKLVDADIEKERKKKYFSDGLWLSLIKPDQ